MEEKEIEELKATYNRLEYEKAAEKYKPDKIKYLLIAESPPHELSKTLKKKRYFYFENVIEGDVFFMNTIKSIYSVETYKGSEKETWLKRLRDDAFFLIDTIEYPIDKFDEKERSDYVRNLL